MQSSDSPAEKAASPSTSATTPQTSEVGPTIGRYAIVRRIGEGSMGRVLLAHDPVLDRDVALKHLREDLKIPRDVRDGLLVRMRHEARAAARVSHPNLVTLHDMGEDPEVGLYLVFEYVEGPTLKQRIAKGRLPALEVARLARDLGDALSEAHRAGIVHRDVKPENVILARNGGKLADFGIARIPDSTLTHQGGLMGTPAYSAPETFKTGTFSPASDQFSLAAAIYEALSGARAFPGDDAVAVASRIATEPPQRFAERIGLSVIVDEVLERALDRDPLARFPTSAQFGEELAAAIAVGSPKIEAAAQAPRQERKLGQVALGGAVVLLTAGLLWRAALHAPPSAASVPPEPSGEPVAPVAAPVLSSPSLPTRPRPPRPRPRTDLSAAPSTSAPTLSEPPRPSASTPLPLPPPAPSGSP